MYGVDNPLTYQILRCAWCIDLEHTCYHMQTCVTHPRIRLLKTLGQKENELLM